MPGYPQRRYIWDAYTGAQYYYENTDFAAPHRQEYSREDAKAVCDWLNRVETYSGGYRDT